MRLRIESEIQLLDGEEEEEEAEKVCVRDEVGVGSAGGFTCDGTEILKILLPLLVSQHKPLSFHFIFLSLFIYISTVYFLSWARPIFSRSVAMPQLNPGSFSLCLIRKIEEGKTDSGWKARKPKIVPQFGSREQ